MYVYNTALTLKHICIYTHIHTHIHTYIHTYIHTFIGHTFEKEAVEAHICEYGTDPISGKPLSSADLIPCIALKLMLHKLHPQLALSTETQSDAVTAKASKVFRWR